MKYACAGCMQLKIDPKFDEYPKPKASTINCFCSKLCYKRWHYRFYNGVQKVERLMPNAFSRENATER